MIFELTQIKGEIYEDPNSVDINSEEFAALPPEMKHEILKDMKEFSKRRRTMYQKPPEVLFILVHSRLLPLPTFFFCQHGLLLIHFLAFWRLFSVPAGRSTAKKPAESASGKGGEGDVRTECWQRSSSLRTGWRAEEPQRGVKPTGFRRQFPLYSY